MQEELSDVLALFREKENHLDIHKTPDVFIDQRSTVKEVKKWLLAKEFSNRRVLSSIVSSGRCQVKSQVVCCFSGW